MTLQINTAETAIYSMTIELKDLIYLLIYIVSLITLLLALKNRVQNIEKELRRGMRVLYQEAGSLNVVDHATCKRHRDEIFTAIRRSEKTVEVLLFEIKDIKENMIIIMVHMGIKKPDGLKND